MSRFVVNAAFPHLLTSLATAPPTFPQPSIHTHTELCNFLIPAGTRAGTTDCYVATSCVRAALTFTGLSVCQHQQETKRGKV